MLRRTLVAVGCTALLAGFGVTPARAHAAAASCPDSQRVLQAYNASHVWNPAGRGAGETIGVIGSGTAVAEAVCAAQALAPSATVEAGTAAGASIVVVTDGSVGPPSSNGSSLVIAAAGDTSGPMDPRPPGIVNVAAASIDSNGAQPTSSYGPGVLLAAFGPDTATASGYVGALAALLQARNHGLTARQVAAQMAGSIGYLSGFPNDDRLGFGNIEPDQAVSAEQIDPSQLPVRFTDSFPANMPAGNTAPSTRSNPASGPSSAAGSGPSGSASDSNPSGPSQAAPPSASEGSTDTALLNPFPTNQVSSGPSIGSHKAAGSGGGSGGFNPILLLAFLVIVAGGGYVLWQRRRRPQPADVKPESEWEAPSGPRHSGYSPPDE